MQVYLKVPRRRKVWEKRVPLRLVVLEPRPRRGLTLWRTPPSLQIQTTVDLRPMLTLRGEKRLLRTPTRLVAAEWAVVSGGAVEPAEATVAGTARTPPRASADRIRR